MQYTFFPTDEKVQPVSATDLDAVLTAAIRDARGGRMSREAEMYLAGAAAAYLAERLELAGMLVVRRA